MVVSESLYALLLILHSPLLFLLQRNARYDESTQFFVYVMQLLALLFVFHEAHVTKKQQHSTEYISEGILLLLMMTFCVVD